ncbi:hypothetical protein SKAU_G00355840 [Synaphobranchus kaupii]|uniref:Uncharacterized protein n=1 Tax=Synaphobranchus kaupii TaxID=118154 RepID=A0A9Q1EHA4_SYNKA|nr:hypothetical protein SKAU_G00355840 [Synaphobranchus kaupii]
MFKAKETFMLCLWSHLQRRLTWYRIGRPARSARDLGKPSPAKAREENLHQLSPAAVLLDRRLGGAHHGGYQTHGGRDAKGAGGDAQEGLRAGHDGRRGVAPPTVGQRSGADRLRKSGQVRGTSAANEQ